MSLSTKISTVFYRYGYGKEGKPELEIGPNTELLYEVTLKDFEKVNKRTSILILILSSYQKQLL